MTTYEQLRADVAALVAKPGPVRRAEVEDVLARNPPPPDDFSDIDFSSDFR